MQFSTLVIFILLLLLLGCVIYYFRLTDDHINAIFMTMTPTQDDVIDHTASAIINTVPKHILSPIVSNISSKQTPQQKCQPAPVYIFPEEEQDPKSNLPWDGDIQKCDELEPNLFYPKSFMVT